jgi:hypothetical protein
MNLNEKRDFFNDLLADPVNIQKIHATELEILIQEYPYSNILYALLAATYKDSNPFEFENKLNLASAYASDRNMLFTLVNKPEQLLPAALKTAQSEKVVIQDELITAEQYPLNDDEILTIDSDTDLVITPVSQPEVSIPADVSANEIDDDVFEEIVAIENIDFNSVQTTVDDGHTKVIPADETERLILGGTISSDYLAYNDHLEGIIKTEPTEIPNKEKAEPDTALIPAAEAKQRVTKYHDDKMPYSFMWWLDKTRREYAGSYQPYISIPAEPTWHESKKKADAELQHQYIENIFHLNTIDDLEQNASSQTVVFDMKRKEDQIIERFIKEEPQIKPPAGDKLDTENKAKRSSEDSDELVTETLARVYIDQMLYHKAADTYKKLALKFPEKSRYFASQIELLQRKTN